MLNIKLPFAIDDLDGNQLLAAGTLLDSATIEAVARKGRQQGYGSTCLLQHERIRSDVEDFMNMNPYEYIFGGAGGVRAHLDRIGEVPIPLPLLRALELFREQDFYTYRHSLVVFILSTFMMEIVAREKLIVKNVLLVGPTHDLGKLAIPLEILNKRTPLTRRERSYLEFHPVAGYVISSYYLGDHQHPAAHVAFNHHERRDGSGYPRGVAEADPLVEMIATCDVYDALTSSRPYRPSDYNNRTALEELTSLAEAGTLSMHCVQALIARNRAGYPTPEEVEVSLVKRGTPPADNCYGKIVSEQEKNEFSLTSS